MNDNKGKSYFRKCKYFDNEYKHILGAVCVGLAVRNHVLVRKLYLAFRFSPKLAKFPVQDQ